MEERAKVFSENGQELFFDEQGNLINQNKMKLIKTVTDNYILVDATKEFHGEGYLLGTTTVSDAPRLSLKNCQAIERGYDLDELAEKHYDVHIKRGHTKEDSLQRKIDFILGFQKALEILGDKKFTEGQVLNAFYAGWISKDKLYPEAQESYKGYLKRRVTQQTEWDVEIEMVPALSNNGNAYYGDIPKTDADGCLILKRK